MTFCLPVLGGCGLCQPCPWLLGSWLLPPRLPSYQVGIAVFQNIFQHWDKPFQKAIFLSDSVFARRGFKTHYGPWSTGGDHQTHITAADLRAPYTTLGYDFHDQVLLQMRIFIFLTTWIQDSASLGAIGYYTSDLLVDRMSDILSEHVGLEKGFFFSGYPEGRFSSSS